MKLEVIIDKAITVLSAESKILKTERIIKDTRYLLGIDAFLSKLAEGILLSDFAIDTVKATDCFIVTTKDKKHTFFFKLGKQLDKNNVGAKDIVFYKYISSIKKSKQTDIFNRYTTITFAVNIEKTQDKTDFNEFNKLYSVFLSGSLPYLNSQQQEIVTLEDKNALVQGVAGSGKTNICIDKIIYGACREYKGKTLYTTYSRGLLIDTEYKISQFKKNINEFIKAFEKGNIKFVPNDKNKKTAIENKLGVWLDVQEDTAIISKLKRIVDYIENKVDYALIEDIYKENFNKQVLIADEEVFLKEYIGNIKNYRLAANLEKIKSLSSEIIYKEIYGMIFGYADFEGSGILSKEDYIAKRANSFSRNEAEIIYAISQDYASFLSQRNYKDNNSMSRELIENYKGVKYSLAVVDEVQDLTQISLKLIKAISIKMFCVGDALQMINPSYFSFAYLKRLMFDKDISTVAELKHNYRNSKLIEKLLSKLSDMNSDYFGTHKFVLQSSGAENNTQTSAVNIKDADFTKRLAEGSFDLLTVVVNSQKKKQELRKIFKRQEILTVSEIKGLERPAVVLIDVLSENLQKWREMERRTVDRKTADENSVYRYYFNLFYVALSRATQYVYVYESNYIKQFDEFFKQNFENLSTKLAIQRLADTLGTAQLAEEETQERIEEFIKQEQYDNAIFAAQKLEDKEESELQIRRIEIYRDYIRKGEYRQGGVRFWKLGLNDDAKKQFTLSGDEKLIGLIDACEGEGADKLDYEIVKFLPDIMDNSIAKEIIVNCLQDDLAELYNSQKQLNKEIVKLCR